MALPPVYSSSGAAGAALTVLDYKSAALDSIAGADGVILVEFPPVDAGTLWLVERITVMCDSSTPTQAVAYAGSPAARNFVDGTSRGNFDTADQASPILIDSNVVLTLQWTGASAGARGTARVQYQLVRRG
jgi:hypothetical protein